MRGPQGVGKSRLASALGLESNTLSSDNLRLAMGSSELSPSGAWTTSQERGGEVWALFDRLAKERMERGETLVLDAMMLPPEDVSKYVGMAKGLDYQVALADFTAFPLEQAIAQDASRVGYRRVGRKVIEKTYSAFGVRKLPASATEGVHVAKWEPAGAEAALAANLSAWLEYPALDLSGYERVVHIGDLQGCFEVLAGPGGPLASGFADNSFYIFCGDLVDRGLENGLIVDWFHKNALGRPNVALLWGNHEDHLSRYAKGLAPVSREFELRTLPQLTAAGVTPEKAARIMAMAVDILPYVWRGQNVVATHAGLTGLPPLDASGVPQWSLLSRRQLSKGAGSYSDPVDETFNARMEELPEELRWTQVHGHRNHGVAALGSRYSVNLEDRVEFGGNLRMATLGVDGWSAFERPNKVFASWRQRFSKKAPRVGVDGQKAKKETGMGVDLEQEQELAKDDDFSFDVSAPIPSWIREKDSAPPTLTPATIASMRAHAGVMEKPMPDRPHISSLNFTRDVFFDKKWDEVVVKARGLFYNTESGEVASRGYEKFFNIGEREDTELSALSKTLKFPVVGYLKENGFLGNLGYDSVKDELMCASKSTTGGAFAGWFKEIFEASTTPEQREEIKRYLRDAEACMVFEVIDPLRDPHMIDYPAAKLTLLDIFHRSEDGLKLGYPELKKAAGVFGLEAKRRMFEFKTMEGMSGWISEAYQHLNYRYRGKDIEGVVFEDAAGFQTKCKLPHYGFWKSMRSSKDRLARLSEKIESIELAVAKNPKLAGAKAQDLERAKENYGKTLASDGHPMAKSFLAWCSGKPRQDLEGVSIIALRKKFDSEIGIDPEWMLVRWDRFDPTEKEEPKAKKGGSTPKGVPAKDAAPTAKPRM